MAAVLAALALVATQCELSQAQNKTTLPHRSGNQKAKIKMLTGPHSLPNTPFLMADNHENSAVATSLQLSDDLGLCLCVFSYEDISHWVGACLESSMTLSSTRHLTPARTGPPNEVTL